MIVKAPHPDDPTPLDAPPSYDTITNAQPPPRLDLKTAPWSGSPTTPASGNRSSTSTPPPTSASLPTAFSGPSTASAKGKGRPQWFNLFPSKTSKDVKSTVLGLVRDLVREDFHSPAALSVLQSCADACTSNDLTLSTLLQEKSVEGHTPLYWAIVKRTPDEVQDDSIQIPDLLTALLSFSTPLTQETMSDIRYACLVTSDQPLFQRLRLSPDFAAGSALDEMLIGVTLPPDEVEVVNFPDDEGSFAVNFEIVKFQKRMMIAKSITVEFIARSRMWRLYFFVSPGDNRHYIKPGTRPGSWCVSLSIMEHSPSTWVDSRLLVADPNYTQSEKVGSPSWNNLSRPKPKPTISMRLKSLQPLTPPCRGNTDATTAIIANFEDSLMATSLQYSGSSYIAPDEKLRARLEARLGKPEHDCIIC